MVCAGSPGMGACISGWRQRVVIRVSRLGISAIAGTGAAITPAHMSSAARGTERPAVRESKLVLVSTCSLIGVHSSPNQPSLLAASIGFKLRHVFTYPSTAALLRLRSGQACR